MVANPRETRNAPAVCARNAGKLLPIGRFRSARGVTHRENFFACCAQSLHRGIMLIQLLDFPEDVTRPQSLLTSLRFRRMELQELLFIRAKPQRRQKTLRSRDIFRKVQEDRKSTRLNSSH